MCAHTHSNTSMRCCAYRSRCVYSVPKVVSISQPDNERSRGSTRFNVISASASAPANVSSSSNSSTGGTNVCQARQKFALFVAHNFLINFLPDADAAHRSEMIYVHMRVCVCVCVATAASAPASTSLSATARHTLSPIWSLSLSTVATDVISEHKVRCRHTQWVSAPQTQVKSCYWQTHTHTQAHTHSDWGDAIDHCQRPRQRQR